jgi:hypothetical protein
MSSEICYKIVELNVAHEVIDGETIIIHFDSGNYYSLEGRSSQIWQWFVARASRQQILDAFQGIKANQIENFDKFVDILISEGLLLTEPAVAGHQANAPIPKGEVAFEAPKITKYNDMQTLLLSDPIHDVDEAGWPNLEGEKA